MAAKSGLEESVRVKVHQPPVPAESVSVRVFGDVVVLHGERVVPVVPRMLRSLLGVLVVHANRVVSADRLIDDLWQDDPPSAPAASLQAYVSNLRKLLEPDRPARTPPSALVTKDPGYSLRLDPACLDLTEFEVLVKQGRDLVAVGDHSSGEEALGRAIAVCSGVPFAELAAEPWAQGTVVRVAELRAAAIEDRMAAWLELGRHNAAVGVLQAAVESDPWRERGWELLLVALYRSQRQADALRAFQECRRRFNDDLGLDPGPQLRRLEQDILDHSPTLAAPATPAHVRLLEGAPGPILVGEREAFIGRNAQMVRMRERIAHLGERGGLVALLGEAGIGKSTLAEQIATEAARTGVKIVDTRCVDTAPPLWPWIQLVRALPSVGSAEARADAERTLRGDLRTSTDERSAVFSAYAVVIAAIREVAAATPLMLIIDDLHVADPATLAVLALVAGDLTSIPVLVVVAARDDQTDSVFEGVMGDLMSHRGAERLTLRGFDVDDVAMFARRFPGADLSDELAVALHSRTAGNPYFLVQLARLVSSTARAGQFGAADVEGAAIPDDLRGVLKRRIERLPTETRSLLSAAAVLGREADLMVLEQTSGLMNDDLMLALEPAIAAGLLVDVDDKWACRFVHPLVHEVVVADMSRLRKARLHAKAARVLLAMREPDGHVTEIAHHLLEAGPVGEPEEAIAYARHAARQAARQGIWSESARLLRSALSLADTMIDGDRETRCDLLIELGEALRCCDDAVGSHAMLETAISCASALGDQRRLTLAAVAFGAIRTWGARSYGVTDPAVISILERQLLAEQTDDTLRVRMLCTLGVELHYTDRSDAGRRHVTDGVALARRIGDNSLLGTALVAQCFITRSPDHLIEHRHAAEDTLALVGCGISPTDELTARIHMLSEHLRRGDFAAFEADLARCRDSAARLRSPELDGHLAFSETGLALLEGRWNDAERLCAIADKAMLATSAPGAQWSHLAGLVACRRTRGLLHEIAPALAATRARTGLEAFRPFDILAVLATETPERALALVHRSQPAVRRDWAWFFTMGGWAEVATALGAPDPAQIYVELSPFAGDIAIAGSGLDAGGPIDGLLAGLAERLGKVDDARRHARASLHREQQLGIRAWEARSRAILDRLGS